MKTTTNAILNPSILGEFVQWGKPSIEINNQKYIVLHIEGAYDRFSINIYPNGKSYLNARSFERAIGERGISLHLFKDTLVELFNTECYDIAEDSNEFIAV